MTAQPQKKVIEAFSPPADMAMEQSTLGAVLLKPAVMDEIIDQVEPADFYREAHRKIFQAMMDLYQQQQPVDLVTVNNLLKDRGQLDEVGGSLFLSGLSEQVGIAANAAYYARGVKDKARLRQLIAFCQETMASCLHDGAKAAAFYDQVESRVFEITQTRNIVHPVNISELVVQEYETLTRVYESKKKPGFETGFADLDKVVSLKPKDLSILAARPSMGKTALGLNISHFFASQGLPVAFFSLEMSKEQLARRTMAARGSVNGVKIDQVSMTPNEWGQICGVQDEVEEWPLEIDDTQALTVLDIRARVRRLKAKQDIKLVVVDYLQLMRPVTKRGNREQEVADTSRGLKALAKELGVHVLALAQLNRELEKRPIKSKRPRLSDLRESGALEQDADVVLFIYRDEVYRKDSPDKGIAEIIVGKQRNGKANLTVKLAFLDDYLRFENLAHEPEIF